MLKKFSLIIIYCYLIIKSCIYYLQIKLVILIKVMRPHSMTIIIKVMDKIGSNSDENAVTVLPWHCDSTASVQAQDRHRAAAGHAPCCRRTGAVLPQDRRRAAAGQVPYCHRNSDV
jgi:hypothetical protein